MANTVLDPFLLTDITAYRVQGLDAQSFLHAQCSSDVKALAVGQCQPSGYHLPNGRVLGLLWILHDAPHSYILVRPDSGAEAMFKRLRLFILRADVRIDPIEQPLYAGLGQPQEGAFAITDRWLSLTAPSNDVAAPSEAALCAWRRDDICAGFARVDAQTQEQYTAQMLNLDINGAVNFKKGCYPGQEIVARTYYLGKPKKRLRAYHAQGDHTVPSAGDTLTDEQDVKQATVVDAVHCDGALWVSAIVNLRHGAAHLYRDHTLLVEHPLPYVLEQEDKND